MTNTASITNTLLGSVLSSQEVVRSPPGGTLRSLHTFPLRLHFLLLLYGSRLRRTGRRIKSPTLAPAAPHLRTLAKRKGARFLLHAATLRNRNRRARESPF